MVLFDVPNFIDIFPECYHCLSSSVDKSSSRDGYKAQTQSDPIKCYIFPWTRTCCYGHKFTHKFRSTTSTNIPLVSKDQPQDCLISSASNSEYLRRWERAQCLSTQSQILQNIKKLELHNLPKIESVFILSLASKMLETLIISRCDGLKHIVIDIEGDRGGNNWGDVFQKLKMLEVSLCEQLEYIFGQYPHDHQNHNEIHLHLPTLKCLSLFCLPNLIGICPKSYHTTLPALTKFELQNCSQFTVKSIGDLVIYMDSTQLDSTTNKDLSANAKKFLTLENLQAYDCKVESIFCLNEIIGQQIGQQMNLGLQEIRLRDLPQMTYLFVGPKYSFALQHLTGLTIKRCEKLEVLFPTSVVRCLPQLQDLTIIGCKELKQIIEEDVENQKKSNLSPKTCFPKLTVLVVKECHRLKCVFPASTSKEIPKLKILIIEEAYELEEVVGCGQGHQKAELPNLKIAIFVQLPNICQGIEWQTPVHCFVQSCPKLSLPSTAPDKLLEFWDNRWQALEAGSERDWLHCEGVDRTIYELRTIYERRRYQNRTAKTTEGEIGPEVEAASGHDLHSSPFLKETKDQSVQECSKSQEIVTATMSTDSEIMNTSPGPLLAPLQKSIKRSAEEGTTSENPKIITSSTHSESVNSSSGPLVTSERKTYPQEDGDGQIATPSFSVATADHPTNEDVDVKDSQQASQFEVALTKAHAPVSLNDDASTKGSSIVEEQFSKDGDKGVLEWKPSPIASQSPSVPMNVLPFKDSELIREPSSSPLDIPLHKTHSHELVDEISISEPCLMNQQQPLGETDITSKRPQGNNEDGDGQIATPSFSVATAEHPTSTDVDVKDSQQASQFELALTKTHAPVSLNDDASTKVSSIIEEQFSKDGDRGVLESKPSLSIPSPIASQSPSVPMAVVQGNRSQIEVDSSVASLVTRELEQLISKKYLASENLSLLTDFLVKHHSVRLSDNALSNKYKGCAYNCLAELLKLLQSHCVLDVSDVLGSSRSDFVELLQDVRSFGFDKDWLDGVERRALFPASQVSQDALQKLLDSKRSLTQHVEDLKYQLASSEPVLESIIQQEAQVLEARAALSAPLGY